MDEWLLLRKEIWGGQMIGHTHVLHIIPANSTSGTYQLIFLGDEYIFLCIEDF